MFGVGGGTMRSPAEDRTGMRDLILYGVICDANHLLCFPMKLSVKGPFWLLCPGVGDSPKTIGDSMSTSFPQEVCHSWVSL